MGKEGTVMQRIRVAKRNAALYCALSLTLTMGMAPALTYAYDLSPQEVTPQLATTTAGKNTNIEAAALTSFQSFGEGCEWMLDASGTLTVRGPMAYQARCPPERGPGQT